MQVVELPGHCFACGAECHTRMFPTAIPHFKDVIIMSNSCDVCGYRDSELKPGGGFSDKGLSITLQVTSLGESGTVAHMSALHPVSQACRVHAACAFVLRRQYVAVSVALRAL